MRFAFHPGEISARSTLSFNVNINLNPDRTVGLLDGDQPVLDLHRKEWQQVEIPLAALATDAPIEEIRFSGIVNGRFYIDDIHLVAARPGPPSTTAVRETRQSAQPQDFVLDQNFPNPFNSGTLIGFALHKAEDVELAVYNLAGQRVMTLAQGPRNAGVYTLRWDGRAEAGRALASGMYLYRLRAGKQRVETRKMLLIR